jgi:hypothetical protein
MQKRNPSVQTINKFDTAKTFGTGQRFERWID